MSTTSVSAGQVMDRAANLLNDPNKTDYKYSVMIPYLNLAIEEFSDLLAEANSPFSNLTNINQTPDVPILVPAGVRAITPVDYPAAGFPKFTADLIEIQELSERPAGGAISAPYRRLPRREFGEHYPATNSLLYWIWERGVIYFNQNGATVDMEVQLKLIFQGIPYIVGPEDQIVLIGSRTYLAYKTAALCARFIGENESRAIVLDDLADRSAERSINISNKGRQQIVTRHRPFRASYKARGGY